LHSIWFELGQNIRFDNEIRFDSIWQPSLLMSVCFKLHDLQLTALERSLP
jgi:hypothetical protein